MARVYATFASGGVKRDTFIVERVTDTAGTVVYEGEREGVRAFKKATMAELTYALTQVVEQGTGVKAQELERPAAAKTGTSEEHRSAWFVGYTPQLVTAVAFYQEGKNGQVVELTPFADLPEINGGALPAQVWVDLMAAEHEGMPVEEFPERPENSGSGGEWDGGDYGEGFIQDGGEDGGEETEDSDEGEEGGEGGQGGGDDSDDGPGSSGIGGGATPSEPPTVAPPAPQQPAPTTAPPAPPPATTQAPPTEPPPGQTADPTPPPQETQPPDPPPSATPGDGEATPDGG
jgi:membrane peptidoglycan carboxypeptidase